MSEIFTARQKMQAAQREVGYRRRVYPRRVDDGKMTQAQADREIAIMDQIALDYGALAKAEEARGDLFGGEREAGS